MARVILESEDKEQFEVLREVAVKSTVIRQMIETNPDNDEPIPLVDRRCCHVIYRQFICFEFVFYLQNSTNLTAAANPTYSKKFSTI